MPRAHMYHAKISVGDEREGHRAFSATVQSCWLEPYVILLEGMMNMALVNSSQGQAAESRTLAMFDFVQLYDQHAAAGLPLIAARSNHFHALDARLALLVQRSQICNLEDLHAVLNGSASSDNNFNE